MRQRTKVHKAGDLSALHDDVGTEVVLPVYYTTKTMTETNKKTRQETYLLCTMMLAQRSSYQYIVEHIF